MPKDPNKNVDRYKVRGGTLNEFELDKNQEAFEGTKKAKSKKGTKTVATRGASAKKLAARKAAKK